MADRWTDRPTGPGWWWMCRRGAGDAGEVVRVWEHGGALRGRRMFDDVAHDVGVWCQHGERWYPVVAPPEEGGDHG